MGFLDKVRAYLNEEDLPEEEELNIEEQEIAEEDLVDDDDIPEVTDDLQIEPISKEESVEEEHVDEKTKKVKRTGLFKKVSKFFKNKISKEDGKEDSEVVSELKNTSPEESERKAVIDYCEQLIDVTYHMEEMAKEYQLVTSYLTDIQRIEELPVNIANQINDLGSKIEMLDKNRQTYIQSENLLTIEQYNTIASMEDEVADAVIKLNNMELRDSMLKSDMGHLEGEKEDLKFMRNVYASSIVRIRTIIITILSIFLITEGALLIVSMTIKEAVTVYALAVGAVAMISFALSYAKYLSDKSSIKETDAKIRRAVSLLNKVKVKFINNTNTLDYIYSKYGVNSSKELEYQWELYNTMVRDARKYSQANTDIRIYSEQLVTILNDIGLKDPHVWPKQTNALVDRREMVEIKHSLNVRRQKIREKVESCTKIKANAEVALKAAVASNPGLESYIVEFLSNYNMKIRK